MVTPQQVLSQVCTFPQAQELANAGAPQQSLFHYTAEGDLFLKGYLPRAISAFTVAELGAMFPDVVSTCSCPTYYSGPSRLGGYYCKQSNGKSFTGATEAEARAAMLIYLLKKGKATGTQDVNRTPATRTAKTPCGSGPR